MAAAVVIHLSRVNLFFSFKGGRFRVSIISDLKAPPAEPQFQHCSVSCHPRHEELLEYSVAKTLSLVQSENCKSCLGRTGKAIT